MYSQTPVSRILRVDELELRGHDASRAKYGRGFFMNFSSILSHGFTARGSRIGPLATVRSVSCRRAQAIDGSPIVTEGAFVISESFHDGTGRQVSITISRLVWISERSYPRFESKK